MHFRPCWNVRSNQENVSFIWYAYDPSTNMNTKSNVVDSFFFPFYNDFILACVHIQNDGFVWVIN